MKRLIVVAVLLLGVWSLSAAQDGDPVPSLLLRHARERPIMPKSRALGRKPRHRRDHRGRDLAASDQLAQSVLDEDPLVRHLPIWIERGEGQDLDRRLVRQPALLLSRPQ